MPAQLIVGRIVEAIRSLASELDLSGLGLSLLPPEIAHLTNLTTLRLNNNALSVLPPEIAHLTNLTTLTLSRNVLSVLPPEIAQLTNLTTLTLNNNALRVVPPEVAQLTNLTDLTLDNNALRVVPPEIAQLTNLTNLRLDNNALAVLPPEIAQLTNLTTLTLDNNELSELPPEIAQLTNLTTLRLNNNALRALPPEIAQLTTLDLGNNELRVLPPEIAQLTNLTTLWLDNNELRVLPAEIAQLTNLTTLYLDNNELPEVPASLYSGRPSDLIAYLLDLQADEQPLNEIKILLLGRGGAGKSSIKDRLIHDSFDPQRAETPGIDIEPWSVELDPLTVRANVWDFAGQEIAHATHRFFLTDQSLYVIVLDARADTQDDDAETWLRIATAFGGDSPVLVVLNKQATKPFDVDEHRLRSRFPNIAGFVRTDCETSLGIDDLRQAIRNSVANHLAVNERFPAAWHQLKEHFGSVDDLPDHQTFSEFRETCNDLGETDPDRQARLARTLHALGLIIHYADDPRLRDTAVLNPEWVTSSVYTLLRAKDSDVHRTGELTFAEAQAVLPNEAEEQVWYLLNLMRRFELCFPLDEGDTWLLPDMLPKFQPALTDDWASIDAIRFRYRYGFLPEGMMAQFITRLHPLSEEQARWRYGVVLEMDGARALVQADPRERRIDVTACGTGESQLRLVKLIRTQLTVLNGAISGLEAVDELELGEHRGEYTLVTTLLTNERVGSTTYVQTDDGSAAIDQTRELNRISSPHAREPDNQPLRAFLSYAHENRDMREKFRINLDLLTADGYLITWDDGQILPSTDWDSEIRWELNQADIIIFLVSTPLLASAYVRGVEMKRALERRAAGDAEIVSVIVEDCSWQARDFTQYQLILADKPVRRWSRHADAYNNVELELRDLVNDIRNRRS